MSETGFGNLELGNNNAQLIYSINNGFHIIIATIVAHQGITKIEKSINLNLSILFSFSSNSSKYFQYSLFFALYFFICP